MYKVLAKVPYPYPLLEAAIVYLTHILHFSTHSHVHRTKQSKPQRLTYWRPKLLNCMVGVLQLHSANGGSGNGTCSARLHYLVGTNQHQDHEIISHLAEADMIMANLECTNSRVATSQAATFTTQLSYTLFYWEVLHGEIETLHTGSESKLESKCTRLEGAVDVA
ncbi:uncharacterized protein BJ212DRAFT_1297304 [Suillus subaureus]|uniref:Uncharacterized protein n=1 Tax=Suillus subaureus TaxID=48587 RepID=A0A9P7EHM9_9AGAM|nr:uncharacterized protein BJ212DRAFT_1297304 [Suillus subaureus]KAG1822063.1 hypothetical protein BJ212DRAFT_1297304 [Suillus subaureus]